MPIVQGNPISILVLKGEKGDSGEGAGSISFANITGNPEDNEALSEILSAKLEAGDLSNIPHKQDVKDLTNNNSMNLIGIFNQLGINIEKEILTMWFKKCYRAGDSLIWYNSNDPNKIFPYSLGIWELTSKGRSIVGRDPNIYKYLKPGAQVGDNFVYMPKHRHKISVWQRISDYDEWVDNIPAVEGSVEIVVGQKCVRPDISTNYMAADAVCFYSVTDNQSPSQNATSKIAIGGKDDPFDENAKIPIEPLGEVCSIWKLLRIK